MDFRNRFVVTLLLATVACGGNPPDSDPAATTTALLSTGSSVSVVVDGVLWALPQAACTGDGAAAAATATAAEVEFLVADRASGWPTTTAALPGEVATFFVTINRAGPEALVLATIAGTVDAIVAGWSDFEAGYGDLPASPGEVTVIADRLDGWMGTAEAIVSGLPAACG